MKQMRDKKKSDRWEGLHEKGVRSLWELPNNEPTSMAKLAAVMNDRKMNTESTYRAVRSYMVSELSRGRIVERWRSEHRWRGRTLVFSFAFLRPLLLAFGEFLYRVFCGFLVVNRLIRREVI